MADDSSVQIRFGASTEEALSGIKLVQDRLLGLAEPVKGLGTTFERLKQAFGDALPADKIAQLAKGLDQNDKAAEETASVLTRSIDDQIKALHQGLAEKKTVLDAEVKQFQITQDQKFALLEAETEREFKEELALLEKKALLQAQSPKEYQQVQDRIALLKQKHDTEMVRLDEQSIAAQQAMWNGYLSSVTSAFNSQLRGLLEGTTNWHKATKKILEDLTIKFIESAEDSVKKWLASELAKTTATTTGAAARASAEETAASSGILANAANALKAILTDAAQTFAGVFAFLAPTMGPAAAGPAAASQAVVIGAATGFETGTDFVVRGGLALIHPGETIIPAARGSGPFTGGAMGAQVHAPVSINISAVDSHSVSRFFTDNSGHMLRAINDAVRRGAHLGLRAAGR